MKKFLLGALTAIMLLSVSAFTEATQVEQENLCCRGGYCSQNCDDDYSGEYCERYDCRR